MASEQFRSRDRRWEIGLGAVLVGVVGLVIAFLVVALNWRNESGVAALGVVASPIAAIVSAYFGIQVGQRAAYDARRYERRERDELNL